MRAILFFVISCLALHNGKGAPVTAVYMFVKCNPEGDQANCVNQKTPEMSWSPDLPVKLPASTAQYLEAEPEEDEELQMEEGEAPMLGEEKDQPPMVAEDGSGYYEGSAATATVDWALGETGSGESWAEKDEKLYKDGEMSGVGQFSKSRSPVGEAKSAEQELKEEGFLKS